MQLFGKRLDSEPDLTESEWLAEREHYLLLATSHCAATMANSTFSVGAGTPSAKLTTRRHGTMTTDEYVPRD
jgi:hypothetical protein